MLVEENYRGILEKYIPLLGINPKDELKVVSVACGRCLEAKDLSDYFVGEFNGIDIQENEIKSAKAQETNVNFLCGDARYLEDIFSEVDLCLFRHSVSFGKDWLDIYHSAHNILKPDGHFLVTSYSEQDDINSINMLDHVGVNILFHEKNLETPYVFARGSMLEFAADYYVIGARKKELSKFEKLSRRLKFILQLV